MLLFLAIVGKLYQITKKKINTHTHTQTKPKYSQTAEKQKENLEKSQRGGIFPKEKQG